MFSQEIESGPASAGSLYLVEEINHRVLNEYAEAISSLSLAARSASPPTREALARAMGRLHAHAETHRALLPPTTGMINLADYAAQICESFSKSSLADSGAYITLVADSVWIASDRCWRIGLILAELVRNAASHGLGGGDGAIIVRIKTALGFVSCVVGDNGACPSAAACASSKPSPINSVERSSGNLPPWAVSSISRRP
jgi:two-component sensor histidine kinase